MNAISGFKLTGLLSAALVGAMFSATAAPAAEPVRVLIVDGQNNHNWKGTTPILKDFLVKSGRFTVDVATTPPGRAPKEAWESFRPKFSDYAAVLSNYNGEAWPEPVQRDLEAYVSGGGGLVIVHAANNAFPEWAEFNKMIGLGWRGADYGPRVTVDAAGKVVETPKGEGPGAGHGSQHDFSVVVRDREHPVMQGIPAEWMHVKDELYDNMRGPIENVSVLATAYSKGTKTHEPMIWTVAYGKGRVFHTPMGHDATAMKCWGFAATLRRGTEWAATGGVTIPLPKEFPTAEKASPISEK